LDGFEGEVRGFSLEDFAMFAAGNSIAAVGPGRTVDRVVVLEHGGDPVTGPGGLLVRGIDPGPGRAARYAEFLAISDQRRSPHRHPVCPVN
jgi:hypothetical protein